MKTLIVQTGLGTIEKIQNSITQKHPELLPDLIFCHSFDEAVRVAPSSGELLVVTSEQFHEKLHRKNFSNDSETIPDREKDGNQLAKWIKQKNPIAKVYIFSTDIPKTSNREFLDDIFQKTYGGHDAHIEIFHVLEKIGVISPPPKKRGWFSTLFDFLRS